MRKACSAVAAVSICLSVAPQTSAEEGVALRWMGPVSCGSWPSDTRWDSQQVAVPLNWVLGYLSAKSAGRQLDLLGSVDQASVKLWIDTYCKAHPLDDLPTAVLALEGELMQRVSSARPTTKPQGRQ